MAKRKHETSDPLGLLFDTICNTFGGIVVISILIAICSSESTKNDTISEAEGKVRKQQQQREASQQAEYDKLIGLWHTLEGSINPGDIAFRQGALDRIDGKRIQLVGKKALADAEQGIVNELAKNQEGQSGKIEKMQGDIEDGYEEIDSIGREIVRIENELNEKQRKLRDSAIKLRTPRERKEDKRAIFVMAYDGRLYPAFTSSLNEYNNLINKIEQIDFGSTKITAIPGMGMTLREFNAYLAKLSPQRQNYYLVLLAYPDSSGFKAARLGKEIAIQLGFDYGLGILENSSYLLTSNGNNPPPL